MGRVHAKIETRINAMERRIALDDKVGGPTLWDELARISDPEARELVALACVVLLDPSTDDEERSLAARWSHETSKRDDWTVADLQARVNFTLPWPDFWPPEHKVVRTVYDYCAEMQARPGTATPLYDGSGEGVGP